MASTLLFEPASLPVGNKTYKYFSLPQISEILQTNIDLLPFSLRILLEGTIRQSALLNKQSDDLQHFKNWHPVARNPRPSISYHPGRVLLQDLTGVPVIVDLASLRSAAARRGDDPKSINPQIPVDLVVDHSIQVDAFRINQEYEYRRNQERYSLLKWAQSAFHNLRIIPPSRGIVHQINLEYISQVVMTKQTDLGEVVFPDTVIGTDSHTTMVNGLGVLGWGVGGIEAIAAMLGYPVEALLPDVVGVHISGKLPSDSMPTDIVLKLTQELRKLGVVNKIVEFYGDALDHLPVVDRAMLSNMAPEYGATAVYFPVDQQTLNYLAQTGRPDYLIHLVEKYFTSQGLFRKGSAPIPYYSQLLEFNLSDIHPSVAGPKRPQDLVNLSEVNISFHSSLSAAPEKRGFSIPLEARDKNAEITIGQTDTMIEHGSVVLAAITSCTNTSNPTSLVAAGLVAQKACQHGLKVKPFTKTSFAPGSRVVTAYLNKSGLMPSLEALGFNVIGYGCTTCIGNSGPLISEVASAIEEQKIIAASVISGNRNFEGRVHPLIQANYLASPALVVAYALAGSVRINFDNDPIGFDQTGQPVYLKDLWPTPDEIAEIIGEHISSAMYRENYSDILKGDEMWQAVTAPEGDLYQWDLESTYLRETPFCEPLPPVPGGPINARALAILGDTITTDHISPAGAISINSPAAKYLLDHGVQPEDFNTYGSRRGNHEVMVRGTFANIRLKNLMLPGVEGGHALHFPDGEQMSIFDAAEKYQSENIPLLILAGKEYGSGSSRDWAAKGPQLLGVKIIIAESFERIHRSNLIGMGILPLQFMPGVNVSSLGLTGRGEYTLHNLDAIKPGAKIQITGQNQNAYVQFQAIAMINSEYELECLKAQGLFQLFMKKNWT